MPDLSETCEYEGRFLRIAKRGSWEYVSRPNATGVVGVIAVDDEQRVVLVEQYRPPVSARVIEIPAGLVGDIDDRESLLAAAKRELEEETGYTASSWVQLHAACSSPGLTDEMVTFFLARGLTQTGTGGGDEHENITVYTVPLDEVPKWLEAARDRDVFTDMKLLAGLQMASAYLHESKP